MPHPPQSRVRFALGGILSLVVLTSSTVAARGQDVPGDAGTEEASDVPAVLVLPFANYTQRNDAPQVLMPHVYRQLTERGITHLSATEIRPILRRHRIRSVGRIGAEAAAILRQETGAEAILVGSFDFYEELSQLEVGLSVRLVDIESSTLLAAASNAATGRDFERLFGLGRIESMEALAERVVNDLIDRLEIETALARSVDGKESPGPCPRVAIVPFDNRSEYSYGGEVFGNILLSALVAGNYVVLEPGAVHEHFLSEQVMHRGQIDAPTLQSLSTRFDLCYVITGVVERYEVARGVSATSYPELIFGARLLDARRGALVATVSSERNGGDSIVLLDMGRCRALGQLTRKTAKAVVERVDDLQRKLEREAP